MGELNRYRRLRPSRPQITHVAQQTLFQLNDMRFEVRRLGEPSSEPHYLSASRRQVSMPGLGDQTRITITETDERGVPLIGPLLGREIDPAYEVDPWKIRAAASYTVDGHMITVAGVLELLGVRIEH